MLIGCVNTMLPSRKHHLRGRVVSCRLMGYSRQIAVAMFIAAHILRSFYVWYKGYDRKACWQILEI